jgi:hypothetical protein
LTIAETSWRWRCFAAPVDDATRYVPHRCGLGQWGMASPHRGQVGSAVPVSRPQVGQTLSSQHTGSPAVSSTLRACSVTGFARSSGGFVGSAKVMRDSLVSLGSWVGDQQGAQCDQRRDLEDFQGDVGQMQP